MEKSKKPIFVSNEFHKKLKHMAVEKQISLEKTIDQILKKGFNIEGD